MLKIAPNLTRLAISAAVLTIGVTAGAASAGTLEDVQERGKQKCGVHEGLTGFAEHNAKCE